MRSRTEKIYENDSYVKSFKATVVSAIFNAGSWEIILDKTAFFPHGGGQACDTGRMDGFSVYDVILKENDIFHYIQADFSDADGVLFQTGQVVYCEIDFEKRFPRMQNHTGEHILSGIIHNKFGFDNVGFHMGAADVTLDINGVLSEAEIAEVEKEANRVVFNNVEVIASYPTAEELCTLNYRSKLALNDNVRIVTVAGCDRCACCAPHVRRTGEIGMIKILDFNRYKGGVRIHILCGSDALEDYRKKCADISFLSVLFSAKPAEITVSAEQWIQKLSEAEQKISVLKKMLIREKLLRYQEQEKNICEFFPEEFEISDLRLFVKEAVKKSEGICAAFSGNDESGYYYVIGSEQIYLRGKTGEINQALSGRGGGEEKMITGKSLAPAALISDYICNFPKD